MDLFTKIIFIIGLRLASFAYRNKYNWPIIDFGFYLLGIRFRYNQKRGY